PWSRQHWFAQRCYRRMALEAFMRIWRRQPNALWITDSTPTLKSSDLRTVVMIFGVWFGFAAAMHYANSPKLYAAVGRFNHALSPLLNQKPTVPLDDDALIVTADHNAELTSVATL